MPTLTKRHLNSTYMRYTRICKLAKTGMAAKTIAKKLNMSIKSVYWTVKQFGESPLWHR